MFYISFIRELIRWVRKYFRKFRINSRSSSKDIPRISSMMKPFLRLAGLSGTLAICLGVYGAHAMKDTIPEDRRRLFQLAQNYHLLHSAALLATPLVSRPAITGSLFAGGLILFCGPIYLHAIRDDIRFRRVTPYGGILLIAGWLSIAVL